MIPQANQERRERRQLMAEILTEARAWLMDRVRAKVPLYEDAEDIVQDVLYQFTGSFDDIRTLEASSSWLMRTARNRVTDFYRKRGRTLEGTHAKAENLDPEQGSFLDEIFHDPADSTEHQFELSELEAQLETAIDSLPPDQREVFIWHEIEGRSYKEIHELTGVSQNTLLSRKRYAIQSLQKHLKEYEHHLKGNS